MDLQVLISFVLATLVLAASPGPDNIYVLIQSVRYGKQSGISVVIGLMFGCLVHTSLVAFGLSTFIKSNENIYFILKLFGTSYMLYLAFKSFRSKLDSNPDEDKILKASFLNLFKQGFIMNVLNPKVSIFFLAFFPAFLFSKTMTIFEQFYVLGFLFILTSFVVFSAYVMLSSYFSHLFFRSSKSLIFLKHIQTGFFVSLSVIIFIS